MADPDGPEPTRPPQAEESPVLDLTGPETSLSDFSPEIKQWDPVQHKAESAKRVAIFIVGAFAGTIALVLLTLIAVMVITHDPDAAKRYTDGVVALLDSLGKFLSAVFTPLLAFILGYYF